MKGQHRIASAVASGLLFTLLIASPAYADHASRNSVLGETGNDTVFLVLAALLLLGAAFLAYTRTRRRRKRSGGML